MIACFFYICLILLLYTYLGYPILLIIISKIKKNKKFGMSHDGYQPNVSMIIPCFNEEEQIKEKLQNTLKLDYPKDKFEILVISDGSTDSTTQIVRKYRDKGVVLIDRRKNQGKTTVQNIAADIAKGEILVFSDANAFYEKNALQEIVKPFNHDSIGGVCGQIQFKSVKNQYSVSGEEKTYWKYEQFLKIQESKITSTIGANGAIYALRRNLYTPLPEGIISDLVEPLMLIKKGFQVLYQHTAVAREVISISFKKEFKRKFRIILRSWHGILYAKDLLNPFKYSFFALQVISHKILRWLIPLFLIVLFTTNFLLLFNNFYRITLIIQLILYCFALIGWILNTIGLNFKIFKLPFYFCLVNLAAFKAFIYFIMGKNIVTWEPQR